MPGLGFQDKKPSRSGFRAWDDSPDSVILAQESNFSLFSSTSGSVDRCSFASDVHDHEALVSEISKHFAGRERDHSGCSSGPDLGPNRLRTVNKNSHPATKGEKAKEREEEETETEDDNQTLDPPQDSFSQALKECQNRRLKSDAPKTVKRSGRRRPASLDLNNRASNATSSSPRLEVMKKSTVSARKSGAFPSPGTPNYRQGTVGMQKGWSSERVPLPVNGSRRYASAALLPLNSGRTLPSKWEDAEKWIFSPVSGDGVIRSSLPHPQRRPKSKSGPLGPPGIAYYSTYSPAMPMYECGNVGNFMAGSPFSAGVLVADGFTGRSGGGGGHLPVAADPCIMRSASVHGCSDMLSQSLLPGTQDTRPDGTKDAATMISSAVSRRDMATQMSPEGSTHSSPKGRLSFSSSAPPSLLPIVELQSCYSTKSEVRDVQVDERVTVARWSRKRTTRMAAKGPPDAEEWRKKAAEAQVSAWEVADTTKCMSKLKREEAKITAWENLQKAKAEAAMRKLEMKLEKKRSSSMDRIMNKLRSAQRKAQEMRNSVSASQARQVTRTSSRALSFRKTGHLGSFSGCFTCHAF
ncbi:uncharacterized protein LOC122089832 [Macadamia integrifolia]|uniref:uncharacterized protein LOC122089832 n=1 Tax=Macadamia integrifolia TaxID=60698 RepID=UPI001C500FD8|nr:uncharacterized protein LOC122089832 [Macadamia integrifolia]XP_042515477.1 uncharacterized protein LOC122089832 [Macadamia integrifolia]